MPTNVARQVLRMFDCLEGTAVGVSLTDDKGRFVRVSDRFSKMTGYTAAELSVKNYVDITHMDDVAQNLRLARRIYDGQLANAIYEKRYVRKGGDVCWVRNSVVAMRNRKGRITNVLAITEDVSELKTAELEVVKTIRVLRGLADGIGKLKTQSVAPISNCRWAAELMTKLALAALDPDAEQGLQDAIEVQTLEGYRLCAELARDIGGFSEGSGMRVDVEFLSHLQGLSRETADHALRSIFALLRHFQCYCGTGSATISIEKKLLDLTILISPSEFRLRPWIVSGASIDGLRLRLQDSGAQVDSNCTQGETVWRITIPHG